MPIINETMLYSPVKEFFENQGYTVRGEVNQRDLVAVRDDTLVVVELKRTFNLTLLLQGMERQSSADAVFLAIEAPKRRNRRFTQVRRLCKRLNLGLLCVTFSGRRTPRVEAVCEPEPLIRGRKPTKERMKLLAEFNSRSGDYNLGGSTGRPIVTAYREDALQIAYHLRESEGLAVKELRQRTGVERAGRILQDNYYGWFDRVRRGVYALSAEGHKALECYADVIASRLHKADRSNEEPTERDLDANQGRKEA